MARLNKHDFDIDKRPALKMEDLGGANAAALTITGVKSGNIPDREAPGGARFTVRLSLEEFPEHQFYVNPAGVTALIEKYGEETDDWKGQIVPLAVRQTYNPMMKRNVYALHVAPLSEWDGIINDTGEVPTEAKHAKPAAKKTTRSRAK